MLRVMAAAALILAIAAADARADGIVIDDRDLVPDETTAIRIATAVMEAYLGEAKFKSFLEQRGLVAMLEGDAWIVCHCEGFELPIEETEDGILLPRAVGLTVMIAKSNGEITYFAPAH